MKNYKINTESLIKNLMHAPREHGCNSSHHRICDDIKIDNNAVSVHEL